VRRLNCPGLYIMIRQRYNRNCVKNVHTYPGADVYTDHCLLVEKMKLKLKVIKRGKMQQCLDLNLLRNEEFSKMFSIEVKNKYNSLREECIEQQEERGSEEQTEQKWLNLKESITTAAVKILPKKEPKRHKKIG